ncbi:MAG TPA: alpha/beta hydrolase [Chloroflexota bacterium]|nr:alpha/beta hydrolase [Chloroflexota bacterium]
MPEQPRWRTVATKVLEIAYEDRGSGARGVVVCLHGWPDDVRTWDRVVEPLVAAGYRVLCPYLRGYGPTRLRPGVPRSGQIAALGQDAVDFLEALDLRAVVLVGHDWGARAAYVAAVLRPERLRALVALSVGYGTSRPEQALSFEQARQYWYQWYFALEQGRQALARDRRDFTRRLWRLWSPSWRFSEAEFAATAAAFDNPDWLEVTIHSYRHRWGLVAGDPRYAALEQRLARTEPVLVPTIVLHGADDGATLPETSAGKEAFFPRGYQREVLAGVGHFPQRERPEVVVAACLRMAGS